MGIESVVEFMAAPVIKNEASGHQWDLFPSNLSPGLPNVYKDFLATYGTGAINEFMWVLNPFSINKNLNIEKMIYYNSSYIKMKELFPGDYEREVPGSFLTWAITDNGDSFFWIIDERDPDLWVVGIHSSDQGEEELTGLNTLEFFEALVKKKLKSSILPKQFLESDKYFISS